MHWSYLLHIPCSSPSWQIQTHRVMYRSSIMLFVSESSAIISGSSSRVETLLTIAQIVWSFLSQYTKADDQLINGGISCSYRTLLRFQLHEHRPVYGALFRVSFSNRHGMYWSLYDDFAFNSSLFPYFCPSLDWVSAIFSHVCLFSLPIYTPYFISVHYSLFSYTDELQICGWFNCFSGDNQ